MESTHAHHDLPEDHPEIVSDLVYFIQSRNRHHAQEAYFSDPERGSDYMGFMMSQVFDNLGNIADPTAEHPGERRAKVYATYGLTTRGGEEDAHEWANVHEHVSGVTAAALTIAKHMQQVGVEIDTEIVREAALLHEATKRGEKVRYGFLYNDVTNIDHSLEDTMRAAGYPNDKLAAIAAAATNTNREALLVVGSPAAEKQYVSTDAERHANIESKSIEALVVGLADARTLGHHFATIDVARDSYLNNPRKQDPASQAFFHDIWGPYYTTVQNYLEQLAPGLDLANITDDTIYMETIRPEARGE